MIEIQNKQYWELSYLQQYYHYTEWHLLWARVCFMFWEQLSQSQTGTLRRISSFSWPVQCLSVTVQVSLSSHTLVFTVCSSRSCRSSSSGCNGNYQHTEIFTMPRSAPDCWVAPCQPTNQVCAILFSLAQSDLVFAGDSQYKVWSGPSYSSTRFPSEHADKTRVELGQLRATSGEPSELFSTTTNLRQWAAPWTCRAGQAPADYQFYNFSLFLLYCPQTASQRLQILAKMKLRHSANYLPNINTGRV